MPWNYCTFMDGDSWLDVFSTFTSEREKKVRINARAHTRTHIHKHTHTRTRTRYMYSECVFSHELNRQGFKLAPSPLSRFLSLSSPPKPQVLSLSLSFSPSPSLQLCRSLSPSDRLPYLFALVLVAGLPATLRAVLEGHMPWEAVVVVGRSYP